MELNHSLSLVKAASSVANAKYPMVEWQALGVEEVPPLQAKQI